MPPPQRSPFDAARLELLAGTTVYDRGRAYLPRVKGLALTATHATARIRGTVTYRVSLTWHARTPDGDCTCPHFASGFFCKHLVALGLAVLASLPPDDAPTSATSTPAGEGASGASSLSAGPGPEAGNPALTPSAHGSPSSGEGGAGGGGAVVDEELKEYFLREAREAGRTHGYVDYWRAPDVAGGLDSVLDELEEALDRGLADTAAPALLRLTTRIRAITLNADDSDGFLGAAGQWAADLYARACREGNPDGLKLGKWLAKFRGETPGWPEMALADFGDSLGEKGLAAYRRSVEAMARVVEEEKGVSVSERKYDRSEVEKMQIELADLDGDVDAAVALLAGSEYLHYDGIIDRLEAAGRQREAMAWLDRAVEAGRIRVDSGLGYGVVVSFDRAVSMYLADGREEDARAMAWGLFTADAAPAKFDAWVRLGSQIGGSALAARYAAEALAWVDAQEWQVGVKPIELALHLGDHERAWEAADRWGAGYRAQTLADMDPQPRPAAALEAYRGLLGRAMESWGGQGAAQEAVAMMRKMRALAALVGAEARAEVDREIAEIRAEYRRRPTLMAAMERAGLP
ncbi:MAG: SWIM zinc finger family protein, partial [bacterium]|nr:SWIM zinc finger family protein [bacterium]